MTRRGGSLLPRIPPPLAYAAFFGMGLGVNRLVTWAPGWMQTGAAHWLGWFLLSAAVVLGVSCLGWFWRRGTTPIPHGQPTHLVTSGPYAMSRNPMYVALTAAYCGCALLVQSVWPLILVVGPLTFVQRVIIPFEEQRLSGTFGRLYGDYQRRVRRWI